MGGDPRTALSILAFPSETLDGEIMYRMLSGAMETLAEAGVALIGGHSIKDEEIKLGFAITGVIDPAVAAALDRPQTGDRLVLTKPLGTGVLAFCKQVGRPAGAGLAASELSMAALNRAAAEAMKAAGASACTDVTGFGLFGHLLRMARQSKLTVQVFAGRLPAFAGALEAFRDGVIPGAVERNREFLGGDLEIAPDVDEAFIHLGCDAQTSGGLLIAIAPDRLEQLQSALRERGVSAFVIGTWLGPSSGRILLAQSRGESTPGSSPPPADDGLAEKAMRAASTMKPSPPNPASHVPSCQSVQSVSMNPSSSDPVPHAADCCADIFEAQAARPGTANETQKAFGAFMRSVQAPGALSAKAKGLILFSLVVYSRCDPCFEAHYAKARELGLTQAELDEAAWCAIAMGGAPVRMFYQECLGREAHRTGTNPI
jgi:selenide,water dikinase